MTPTNDAPVTVEREAIKEYLIACADECDQQGSLYAQSGNVCAVPKLRAEAKAYRNAARMVSEQAHASYRLAALASAPAEPVPDRHEFASAPAGDGELPDSLPGHWDGGDGAAIARACTRLGRSTLCKGDLSDMALANAVYLAGRDDLDLIVWQTAAKERIRWLSAHLAAALARPRAAVGERDIVQERAKIAAILAEHIAGLTLQINLVADAILALKSQPAKVEGV
jgi:hypothetical protein